MAWGSTMSSAEYRQMMAGQATRANPLRQMAGAKGKKIGKMFEIELNRACVYYRLSGVAKIKKTPEPFCVTGKHKKGNLLVFEGFFEAPADPDYQGTLPHGRSIVFEAKATSTSTIAQKRVTEEQEDALREHYSMGAEVFVMLCFRQREYFRLPWEVWDNMQKIFGRKSVHPTDLERYRIPVINGVVEFLHGMDLG